MSPRFVLGRENVPFVTEVVNRSLKADCTDFSLRFLWTILQKNNDDPVRMVYNEMLKYPFQENWANDVMRLRSKHAFSMDDLLRRQQA